MAGSSAVSSPQPAHSGIQVRKWLALSHHSTESYRSRLFPVTSMRNCPMISVNAPHGAGSLPFVRRWCHHQIAGGASIINGFLNHQTDGKGFVLEPLDPGNERRDHELRKR